MLTQERYQSILRIINQRNAVTVAELAQMLDTSESTIRRDLNALDELGKINKVFGGATAVAKADSLLEDNIATRESLMRVEKTEIAKYCATLINDGDFVYIDSGTTTSRLIDFIENNRATYVTNGISHARKLVQKGMDVFAVGGKVRMITEAVVGAEGIQSLRNFNFTKAFMGTNGIDLTSGFTTPDVDEALMKEEAINRSYIAFIIADHTKFRKVFPVTFSPITKCCIITDKTTDSQYSQKTIIKEVMK